MSNRQPNEGDQQDQRGSSSYRRVLFWLLGLSLLGLVVLALLLPAMQGAVKQARIVSKRDHLRQLKKNLDLSEPGRNPGLLFIPEKRLRSNPSSKVRTGGLQVAGGDEDQPRTFPLLKTDVDADIDGFVGSVSVEQTFRNPYSRKIEAKYTFPLPHTSSITGFRMKIGDRTIRGVIRKQEKAEALYRQAKRAGYQASLLDQKRPNVFEEKVAHLEPGRKIKVSLTFFQYVSYRKGHYEWVFPLVVAPRYQPDSPSVPTGARRGTEPATESRPDADPRVDTSRSPEPSTDVNPPALPPGQLPGHRVDLDVDLDAGMPVDAVNSPSHRIEVQRKDGPGRYHVSIEDRDTVPNKDFILRWSVRPEQTRVGFLTGQSEQGRFFTLLFQPPLERDADTEREPIEWVFVVDRSGSMKGSKIDQARTLVRKLGGVLQPGDRLRLISFSNRVRRHVDRTLTDGTRSMDMMRRATAEIDSGGGTNMHRAVEAVLSLPDPGQRKRICLVISDALYSQESRILNQVRSGPRNMRWFFTAVGQAPNRFLSSRLAELGQGDAYSLRSDADPERIVNRIQTFLREPVVEDLRLEWRGVEVRDLYPAPDRMPDLFADRPFFVTGRMETDPDRGTLIIHGRRNNQPVQFRVPLRFRDESRTNHPLGVLWARHRIRHLMNQWMTSDGDGPKQRIVRLSRRFRIMSQFTSFVAVDRSRTTGRDPATPVEVPAQLPEGMRHEQMTGASGKTPMTVLSQRLGFGVEVRDDGALVVTRVQPDSAAEQNGLTSGAEITAINGRTPARGTQLRKALNRWSPSETLTLTFRENGRTIQRSWMLTKENGK